MCDIAVVALIIFTLLLFSLRSLVSPAPTNAPKPSVLSQSLLSDLEGLSLSNISSTVQVSVCVCARVCMRVLDAHRLTFPPSMCVESQSFLSVWHWQYSRAAYEMVKWASLPCGTFLLQTPTIDLFCLVIFIASQDGPTALVVSCISYSLSFSPSLSFALPHPWSLFLSRLWVHPLALSRSLSLSLALSRSLISLLLLCHPPSLSVRCCVPCVLMLCISDGWPFPVWRLLSLLSIWATLHVCVFCILSPSWEGNVQTILCAVAVSYFVSQLYGNSVLWQCHIRRLESNWVVLLFVGCE